jgi:hypothetical protein
MTPDKNKTIQLELVTTQNFTGFDVLNGGKRVALWGPGKGGHLSIKNKFADASPQFKAAFHALGPVEHIPAEAGKKNFSTPCGGTNFYGTVRDISLEQAREFLNRNGFEV